MSDPIVLDGYYNRFDPSKNYERHLVRAGKGTQSAELNEVQSGVHTRIKGLGDALLADGGLIRNGQCQVNSSTGLTRLGAGDIYLLGAVRSVAAASFTIPVNQTVSIGVRLVQDIITELQDPALRDPATGTRNYDEPGAARLRIVPSWGWDGDGGSGDFYPVYTVENGFLLSKEPPPNLDGVTNAIATYDRDSAGGNYVINGLEVSATYDSADGEVTVLVSEGRARVNGYAIELPRSLRLVYDADADTKEVLSEPKIYTPTSGSMRIELDNAPLLTIDRISAVIQVTETITRGPVSGGRDTLTHNSVLALVSASQGGTTYVQDTDYKLTSGEVDWSLAGAEPAPGSTYTIVYQYQSTSGGFTVSGQDSTGFTISGPVSGSSLSIDYTFALPRIDAMTLDESGRIQRIIGVASQYNPGKPSTPSRQLHLASLSHSWDGNPKVSLDSIVVMPMQDLRGMQAMIFDLYDLVAQERLRNVVALTDPAAKRGVFVEPFTNDNVRDAGIGQSLVIYGGEANLPITETVSDIGTSITTAQLLPYTLETVVEQPFRTSTMLVNPYSAFDPVPPTMTLEPDVDFWTESEETWATEVTRRFTNGVGSDVVGITTSTGVEVTSSSTRAASTIRQRYVGFKITGMGAGENLASLTFDGIAVTPEAAP